MKNPTLTHDQAITALCIYEYFLDHEDYMFSMHGARMVRRISTLMAPTIELTMRAVNVPDGMSDDYDAIPTMVPRVFQYYKIEEIINADNDNYLEDLFNAIPRAELANHVNAVLRRRASAQEAGELSAQRAFAEFSKELESFVQDYFGINLEDITGGDDEVIRGYMHTGDDERAFKDFCEFYGSKYDLIPVERLRGAL